MLLFLHCCVIELFHKIPPKPQVWSFLAVSKYKTFPVFFTLLGEYFNRWGNLCHECSFPRDLLYEPKLFLARREARLCYVYWKTHLLILGTCDLLSSQYHEKIWICIRAVSIANRCICSPSLPAEGVIWLERKSPPSKSTSRKESPPAAYQNLAKRIRSCRLHMNPLLPLTLPRANPLMPPFEKVYKKLDSEAAVPSTDS